jgi:hypothetical protein
MLPDIYKDMSEGIIAITATFATRLLKGGGVLTNYRIPIFYLILRYVGRISAISLRIS